MKHRVLVGKTYHQRIQPVSHIFKYPLWYVFLNLSHLKSNSKITRLFGYNRISLLSVSSQDYISKSPENLYQKYQKLTDSYLQRKTSFVDSGFDDVLSENSVYLLSLPRLIGKQFNPVSFYLELNAEGQLQVFTLEINNTFGEKHHYILKREDGNLNSNGFFSWNFPKTFHVSPFNEIEGHYQVQVKVNNSSDSQKTQDIHIKVDLYKQNQIAFRSGLVGTLKPLSDQLILRYLLLLPFQLWLVTTKIGIQAFKLYFFRSLGVYEKPEPKSPNTQKWGKPVLLQRILTGDFLEKLQKNRIRKKV